MKKAKAKVVKRVKAPKKVVSDSFKATAIILGKKYTAIGETVSDALSKLEVGNCKGKCILVVQFGDQKKERVLMPFQAYRLFSKSRLMREIALKQVSMLFF